MQVLQDFKYLFPNIIARSSQMRNALKLAAQVTFHNTTVMLLGESGTGKELLAKAIHENSPRALKPMVAINCSAFPENLIESELFGYEKGAFTGAEKFKPGKIQQAEGGTLFLDEVSELSSPAQAKILRVIQERQFEPLGSLKTVPADIRIIAATNKDLEAMVVAGAFREDLFYRLFVFPIYIPPLRERREDLFDLIVFFINKFSGEMGKKIVELSPDARKFLMDYQWPGNVRELQNVIERITVITESNRIDDVDLPRHITESSMKNAAYFGSYKSILRGLTLDEYVHRFEAGLIIYAMKRFGFNQFKAAEFLRLPHSTFRYKLSQIRRDYKKYFCEDFLTALCKPCKESAKEGKDCAPLMDNFFSQSLAMDETNGILK